MRFDKNCAFFWVYMGILASLLIVIVTFTAAHAAVATVSGGQSVMNSLQDPHGGAFQFTVRGYSGRTISRAKYGVEGGYLNLGHQGRHKIDGLFGLYQVRWRFHSLSAFAGTGPYLAADTLPTSTGYQDRYSVDWMLQFGAAYHFGQWLVSGRWERLTSWRSQDEDVFLVGVGRSL